MAMGMRLGLVGIGLAFAAGCADAESSDMAHGRLVIHPAPDGIARSGVYDLAVEGRPVPCLASYRCNNATPTGSIRNTRVSGISYAIFDFAGTVEVVVTPTPGLVTDPDRIVVRPLASGIEPVWTGAALRFTLDRPGHIVVDLQGDGQDPLLLFTNAPESDPPDRGDPSVVSFPPGVHDVEQVVLHSGQTLYLAGGAVLRPKPALLDEPQQLTKRALTYERAKPMIAVDDATGVTIRGRGIVTGWRAMDAGTIPAGVIRARRTRDLVVRDIALVEANCWNVHVEGSTRTLIENLKIVAFHSNPDGICFDGSSAGVARDCFVLSDDDCYEVKASKEDAVTEDILFERCIAWSDFAACMGVTHAVLGTIRDVTFRDMQVVRYSNEAGPDWKLFRAPIFVHAVGGGSVSDIVFEDVVIEQQDSDQPVVLIDNLRVHTMTPRTHFNNRFADSPRCRIEDIVLRRVRGSALTTPEIVVYDESGAGLIDRIHIEDVVFNGSRLETGDERIVNHGGGTITVTGETR